MFEGNHADERYVGGTYLKSSLKLFQVQQEQECIVTHIKDRSTTNRV